MHRVSEWCREGHHGMIAPRVYSYYRTHIYQARGAELYTELKADEGRYVDVHSYEAWPCCLVLR